MDEFFLPLVLHLIESTIWVILFLGIIYFLCIKSSRAKCWLLRLALLKFLVPLSSIASWISIESVVIELPRFVVSAESIVSIVENNDVSSISKLLIYSWLAGVVVLFLLALGNTTLAYVRIHKNATPFDLGFENLLQNTLLSMGLPSSSLNGEWTKHVPSIALYGFFRPRIIAKYEFLESLEPGELEAAFRHEIVHWIRRDNLWKLFSEAVPIIFWFHPLVWLIRNRLNLETEKACDESVLSIGHKPGSYARCLLKAAEFSHRENRAGIIALSEKSLKQRVANLAQIKTEKISIMKKTTIVLTCTILIGVSLAVFVKKSPIGEGHIYEMSELDVQPSKVEQSSLKDGTINTVVVIDELGNLSQIMVEKGGATDPQTANIALDFITRSKIKFTPGKVDGKPVKVRAPLTLKYSFQDNGRTFQVVDSLSN